MADTLRCYDEFIKNIDAIFALGRESGGGAILEQDINGGVILGTVSRIGNFILNVLIVIANGGREIAIEVSAKGVGDTR